MKRILAVLASCVVFAAGAQGKGAHKEGDDHKPKYGGIVKEVKEIQYELVAKPDAIAVYIEDHGKKVDANGTTGKLALRQGSNRTEVALSPAEGNRLEAKGTFNVAPGTVAILAIKRPGQAEETVRFTLK